MKVFLINTHKAWGGGEKWHFETALTLKKKGYEIVILCAGKSELFNRSKEAGIPVIILNTGNLSFLNPFLIISLTRLFRARKPDIVILNLSSDIKTAGIAAKLARVKNIIYRRGNAKPVKNSLLNRLLFKKIISSIIANSEDTRKAILANNSSLFPIENIRVLYNGINLKLYDLDEPVQIYDFHDNRVILGSAGRLSHEKGHHLLIQAASRLKEAGISFILLIAGEGPEKDSLVEQCRKSGLENDVVFAGFIKNIKSFMETIDIFILPSLWEGFGYVTIEAMASRKPVVAFKTGSNGEIIEDGKTGLLIPCYHINEMAEKISLLCSNNQLRQTMGEAGRKRTEQVFNSVKTDQALFDYLGSISSENA